MTRDLTCKHCQEGTVVVRGEVRLCNRCGGRGSYKRHPFLQRLPQYRLGMRR